MSRRHHAFWPRHLSHHLGAPETNLFFNVEVSAARYPHKPYLIYFNTAVTFLEFKLDAERLAGYLEQKCGVRKGDRVMLCMQNSPQFALAFYAILRANAVVVPVNPMNLTDELRHHAEDSGATVALIAQELYPNFEPLVGVDLQQVVVATYSDYLRAPTDLAVPEVVKAPRLQVDRPGVASWKVALGLGLAPGPLTAGPDDLCVLPYTSGTTGRPKGCIHTHRTVMHTLVAGAEWFDTHPNTISLGALPLFHVTGMQACMNAPMYRGYSVVLMPRWDRNAAAELIQRYRVTLWSSIPTMVIDFLATPRLAEFDHSSLQQMTGGGAAMPAAIGRRLEETRGISYVEGYGLSETMAPTHINPPQRPKNQCLGIPIFDTDARVVDPDDLHELPPGEAGEIVVSGPQVCLGYWNAPHADAEAFIELDGKRFLRTGDLGRTDEDGYYFLVDRLKRMINASGYKVWPAEVESILYQHPAIQEVCIISAQDPYRGETVKAVVVPKAEAPGKVSGQEIIEWASNNMAAYKYPRIVEFVESLQKGATGKVNWRALQEREQARG